jgi:uncharacterized membrane protein
MAAEAPAQLKKRHVRKRIWIPSVLLALLVLGGAWVWWRGTNAETVERNPASAADGPVTQLLTQDGRTFVRSAIVVAAPPAAVWHVVTDYDSHPKFIRYIAELSTRKLDDSRVRLAGVARSRLWGSFSFEIDVSHDEKPAEGEYSARWNEEGKAGFLIDRGGWTVRTLPGQQTLLIFSEQAELQGYPNFLVRNILIDRVGTMVQSVRDEVAKRGAR